MLFTQLASQMKLPSQARRLHLGAWVTLGLLAAIWMAFQPQKPSQAVTLLAYFQLSWAILVGGALTGWRVTQMPKTRASEFYLMTPVSDWEIVGGEVLSGMLRSAYVICSTMPLVTMLWGLGWMELPQAIAIVVLPVPIGWATGLTVAVVAYQPVWMRRLGEKFFVVGLVIYLVGFGVLGMYTVPRINSWWTNVSGMDLLTTLKKISPAHLIELTGEHSSGELLSVLLGLCSALLIYCFLSFWRLKARLRAHYLEEVFGAQRPKKDYQKRVADNPLSWWTIRRVSRFRGHINLYLAWTTILLYSSWLIIGKDWPMWLGGTLLLFLYLMGGAAMLGTTALQFGLVPAAFLSGLWDSTPQQRVARLELLLTTPLEPRHFLWGSVAAIWTRAKGYFLAATFVWAVSACTGNLPGWGFPVIMLVAANYVLFYFAIVFRKFANIGSDRSAATWGLTMSVGIPMVATSLLLLRWQVAALIFPISSLYLLARPNELVDRIGLPASTIAWIVVLSQSGYFFCSLILIWQALKHFETEIRLTFSDNLARPKPPTPKPKPEATQTPALEAS